MAPSRVSGPSLVIRGIGAANRFDLAFCNPCFRERIRSDPDTLAGCFTGRDGGRLKPELQRLNSSPSHSLGPR